MKYLEKIIFLLFQELVQLGDKIRDPAAVWAERSSPLQQKEFLAEKIAAISKSARMPIQMERNMYVQCPARLGKNTPLDTHVECLYSLQSKGG